MGIFVFLFISLSKVRLGYIGHWVAPEGLDTAGLDPKVRDLPQVLTQGKNIFLPYIDPCITKIFPNLKLTRPKISGTTR